jgi:conjugative transposon TraM protein
MSTNNQTDEKKSGLSTEQKQKMKKYAVFALMGVICAGCMWLIFAPSAEDKARQEQTAGFNADIPLPKEEGLIGDKRDAYEQEQIKQKQAERMRSLEDFSAMLGGETAKPADNLVLLDDEPQTVKTSSGVGMKSRTQSSIQSSAQAYNDINRTLGGFYETPREDPEKEALKQELEALKNKMDESETKKNLKEEQMEMMEKSFQMASRYMPGTAGTTGTAGMEAAATEPVPGNVSSKPLVVPVSQVRGQTVSVMQQEMSGAEFMEAYGQPRNMGFVTATTGMSAVPKNTISACVHGDQTVMGGQNVRLRLLEPLQAGRMVIPRNTLLSGTAKIQGERLDITVHTLEYAATILPVGLTVYDLDGQRGIFIPDLQELNAAKEIAANMGTSAGTSINFSNDAGEQFVADMGRNLIQGVSQFTAKKLREVKVHLKAGYRIYLLSEEQLKNNVLANNQ